ncbi:hypothetical protein BT63DRAFT_425855 [Microthyrium microscopicum]|uniref:Zn(2)-C6 fungal-type domain-containing protein n=1 Tax=Microthyrium microscopicum TaxID=703497 RepID=A0A6A6U8F5_9PEZI|nr:hypothetical protein BT63DRAFT_425855 [Microthyrium microscopicum]
MVQRGNGDGAGSASKPSKASQVDIQSSKSRARAQNTDEELPHQKKRLRVSRACDQCRKRRDRCDGEQPACRQCVNAKRSCTYNASSKKRGLPAGYVRAMELLLGIVFSHINGSEDLISTLLDAEEDLIETTSLEPHNASTRSLLDVWRKSQVVKQMERLSAIAESAEDDDLLLKRFEDRLIHALSVTSGRLTAHIDHIVPDMTDYDDEGPVTMDNSEPQTLAMSLDQITDLSPSLDMQHEVNQISGTKENLQLPPNWRQLLDIYFANTHCWFPISQKHDLLRPAYELANSSRDQHIHLASGDYAFLWAVFTYSSYPCPQSNRKADATDHNEQDPFSPSRLEALALSLVSHDQPSYDAGHIRAVLVLALHNIRRASWTSAWLLVGQAVYLAVDLTIIPPVDLERPHSRTTSIDDSDRRAVLGCFALDTLISAHLRRRPYLSRTEFTSIGLVQVNGNEEWEAWQPVDSNSVIEFPNLSIGPGRMLSIFNQFLTLMAILNDLVQYSDTLSVENEVWKVSDNLKNWKEQLPSHCQISANQSTNRGTVVSQQILNLNLAYTAVDGALSIKRQALLHSSGGSIPATLLSETRQLISVIVQHIHILKQFSLPPTFEIYLLFCNQFMALPRSMPTQPEVDDLIYEIKELISQIGATWREPHPVPEISLHAANSIQDPIAGNASTVRETTFPAAARLSDAGLKSYQTPTSSYLYQLEQHSQLSHSSNVEQGVILPSLYDQGTENPLTNSLTNESEEDTLFNSLAMLDPVDWTANQPEFMEHLGFMPDFNQADYQSYFNQ